MTKRELIHALRNVSDDEEIGLLSNADRVMPIAKVARVRHERSGFTTGNVRAKGRAIVLMTPPQALTYPNHAAIVEHLWPDPTKS